MNLEEAILGDQFVCHKADFGEDDGETIIATVVGIARLDADAYNGRRVVVLLGWRDGEAPANIADSGDMYRNGYPYEYIPEINLYTAFYPVWDSFNVLESATKQIIFPEQKCTTCSTHAPHAEPNQPDKTYMCIVCKILKDLDAIR